MHLYDRARSSGACGARAGQVVRDTTSASAVHTSEYSERDVNQDKSRTRMFMVARHMTRMTTNRLGPRVIDVQPACRVGEAPPSGVRISVRLRGLSRATPISASVALLYICRTHIIDDVRRVMFVLPPLISVFHAVMHVERRGRSSFRSSIIHGQWSEEFLRLVVLKEHVEGPWRRRGSGLHRLGLRDCGSDSY